MVTACSSISKYVMPFRNKFWTKFRFFFHPPSYFSTTMLFDSWLSLLLKKHFLWWVSGFIEFVVLPAKELLLAVMLAFAFIPAVLVVGIFQLFYAGLVFKQVCHSRSNALFYVFTCGVGATMVALLTTLAQSQLTCLLLYFFITGISLLGSLYAIRSICSATVDLFVRCRPCIVSYRFWFYGFVVVLLLCSVWYFTYDCLWIGLLHPVLAQLTHRSAEPQIYCTHVAGVHVMVNSRSDLSSASIGDPGGWLFEEKHLSDARADFAADVEQDISVVREIIVEKLAKAKGMKSTNHTRLSQIISSNEKAFGHTIGGCSLSGLTPMKVSLKDDASPCVARSRTLGRA